MFKAWEDHKRRMAEFRGEMRQEVREEVVGENAQKWREAREAVKGATGRVLDSLIDENR